MHKGYFTKRNMEADGKLYDLDKSPLDHKRGRRRPILSPSERLAMAHAVLIEHRQAREVAKEYRVSVAAVYQQVQRASKKPEFIRELYARAGAEQEKCDKVKAVVEHMIEQDEFIDSVKMVADKVEERYGPVGDTGITGTHIRRSMKDL